MLNKAGKDAVYEAEANDKHHVAQWLLLEGMGLDKGAKGTGGEQEMEGYGVEGENAGQSEEVMLERPAKEGG